MIFWLLKTMLLLLRGCVNKKNHYQKNNVLLVGPVNSVNLLYLTGCWALKELSFQIYQEQLEILLVVSCFTNLIPFCFDSAGLRDTDDFVEGVGIKNTLKEIKSADLVVGVFEVYNKDMIDKFKNLSKDGAFVCIQNKIDINSKEEVFLIVVFLLKRRRF